MKYNDISEVSELKKLMDDEVTMKINIVVKLFIATVTLIGIIYFLGIRFTPELALKAYEADDYTVVGIYQVNRNSSFILYKNNC